MEAGYVTTHEPQSRLESSTMLEEEVVACSFDNWYGNFKDLTLRSCVIPLPEDFVKYLLTDGISLPAGADDNFNAANDDRSAHDSDGEWGDGGSDSEDGNPDSALQVENLAELQAKIDEAIVGLGGSVLPKLNWSAPKDARWLRIGGLKCETSLDVFTLLKASDFIAHDLCHSFDHCEGTRKRPDEFSLVLRRWYDLDESGEFRCFVHGGQLLAVCQRHTSIFLPHLCEADFLEAVAAQAGSSFERHIRDNFPLQRYVFDIFVGKQPRRKVTLVDFSPWGETTDPLLFEWEELREMAAKASTQPAPPVVRTVKNQAEVRSKIENYHQMPLEVAQMGAMQSAEVEELCARAQAGIAAQT